MRIFFLENEMYLITILNRKSLSKMSVDTNTVKESNFSRCFL
jgi:hypothetical protein